MLSKERVQKVIPSEFHVGEFRQGAAGGAQRGAIPPYPARGEQRMGVTSEGESGFTLIEAILAMLVTVVGITAVAGSFVMAMRTNTNSQSLTAATTFAQDKLEQLETTSFQQLADPARMGSNPNSHGSQDALMVGSLDSDVTASDGSYYYDKIILAGQNDVEPEGTIAIVRPDGTAETRRPDGTITQGSQFPAGRVSYERRWVVMSSNEQNIADRRLTIAVRVVGENATGGTGRDQVDLYTILTNN
ncbi:MAG: type IV pilus modification PilV family protein [Blastocatellia bacterium]